MGKIKMLSEGMIGKIAAGEVVERPVSAMKELIENSLDAGASAVTAEIREGGLTYLRVTDNGSGIEESDLRLAFERHATSKISKEQDLFSIQTLGFRGEALASIAAVSHVVMTTRTARNETGLKVTNEGGKILSIDECACTEGTTIVVTDLFFNTPVRKGFMKKASTEASAVTELITQFILSRPDVSFRYINGGKAIYHTPGDGQLASAVHSVFGGQTLKSMRKVDGHENGVMIHGYVGIGENARGNRGQEYFFINGRMMHSALLSSALEQACRERVMIGKFPICALHLQIAYEAVDVNVHPNKLEVRFRDEQGVSEAVSALVMESLRDKDAFQKPVEMLLTTPSKEPVPEKPTTEQLKEGIRKNEVQVTVSRTLPPPAQKPEQNRHEMNTALMRESQPVPINHTSPTPVQKTENEDRKSSDPLPSDRQKDQGEQVNTILPTIRKPMKVFGALFHTFILVEYEDQLLLIDQHAVHERLLFDRLMRENEGQKMAQEMLVPIVLGVTKKEQALLEENKDVLSSIGLTIEPFGEQDIAVRSIPVILGQAETAEFVRDVISGLESGRAIPYEKKRSELLQAACKHAVKGGEALPDELLRNLVEDMLEKHVTPTCPHGRPLVVAITHRELDKKFKRIQD